MARLPFATLCLTLLALTVGCSNDDATDAGGANDGAAGGSQAEYLLCTEPAGSWTDLTDEDESWRANAIAVPWTDETQCAIRLDTMWHRFGQEHCGWEATERISIGLPIGTPYTGPEADPPGQDWDPFFFFNTDGVFPGLPAGEVIATADVPASAIDTGMRTVTGRQMSIAEDESALYEIQGDVARVFVRSSDDDTSCA